MLVFSYIYDNLILTVKFFFQAKFSSTQFLLCKLQIFHLPHFKVRNVSLMAETHSRAGYQVDLNVEKLSIQRL